MPDKQRKPKDEDKNKKQLIAELVALRRKTGRLERICRKPEAHSLLETLFSNTHLLIACLDSEFNFIRVNAAYAGADGKTPDFFPGKNHFDLYPNPENESVFRQVRDTGKPYFASTREFDYAESPERGAAYWDWTLEPITSSDGSPAGLLLMLINQTKCRLPGFGVQRREERYNRRLETAEEIRYVMDFGEDDSENGKVTFIHDKIRELTGYEPEEFKRNAGLWLSLVHPDDQASLSRRTITSREGSGSRYFYRIKHGESSAYAWIEDSVIPRYDKRGKVIGLEGALRDVTRDRETRHYLELFRGLIDRLSDAVYIIDPNTGKFLDFNKQACLLLGYCREELLQIGVRDVQVLAADESVWTAMRGTLIEKTSLLVNGRHRRKDGSEFPVEVQVRRIDLEGKQYWVASARDITERKQREQELQEQQETIKALLNATREAALLLDLNGNLFAANDGAAERLGGHLPDLIGKNLFDYLPPEVGSLNKARMQDVAGTGRPVTFREVGQGRVIDNTLYPVFDASGRVHRIAMYLQDVTIQYRAESNLRKSEERLNFLLSNSPAVIYTSLASGDYATTFISANSVQQFGYWPHEFTGDPAFWAANIHPDDAPGILADLPRLFKKGIHSYEYRFRDYKGAWRWMRDDMKLIRDADGKPVEIIGSWMDITDRKKTEDELKQSEERFRSIADSLPDVIYRLDQEGVLTYVSAGTSAVLGFSQEETIGTSFTSYIHHDDKRAAVKAFHRLMRGETIRDLELRLRTRQAGYIHAALNIVPIKQDGRVVKIQGVARDITERKRIEKQQLQSLQEKETLLGEVHHRVKNNLQIIASLLYLQSEKVKDPEVMNLFRESRDRIQSMSIVHEKLYQTRDFSRVDLSSYVESLSAYLAHAEGATMRGITIETRVENVLLDVGTAVPCGLILNELISNALKHAFPCGKTGTIAITGSGAGGNRVSLTVRDDGIGFPPDRSIEKVETLGLRLVHNLAKQLNGTIEITSRPGAAITVTFPLKR